MLVDYFLTSGVDDGRVCAHTAPCEFTGFESEIRGQRVHEVLVCARGENSGKQSTSRVDKLVAVEYS